jgi:DNA-binding transcriptional regulator YdaS (Cro superfamily)
MTLKEYFDGKPRGAKSEVAAQLGISRTYMSLLVSERRLPGPEMALMIERVTAGSVTRKVLRPDLFGEIR